MKSTRSSTEEHETNVINIEDIKILNAPLPSNSEEHFSNIDFYNNSDKKVYSNTGITKSVNEPYKKLFYEHEKEQKEYSPQLLGLIKQEKEGSKEDAVFEQILEAIRETNGHEISVNAIIESLRIQNERVKEYSGHVAIQKDNPNVKNIYLKIIRHNNIEVVRHRPDLIVKWVKEQNTEHQLSSDYDENVYDKQHQQDSAATNAEALH